MAHGSMRQRGKDSWELRVYWGIDRATGRQRWITRTVHGTQRFARGQLEDLLAEAGRPRVRAGTLADLLDLWFEAASQDAVHAGDSSRRERLTVSSAEATEVAAETLAAIL